MKQESLKKEDLAHFCKNIAHMSEINVKDFYNATKFHPDEAITKEQFIEVYSLIKEVKFIKLLQHLVSQQDIEDPNKFQFMNFEDDTLTQHLLRRLHEIKRKKTLREAQDDELTEFEMNNIKDFFDTEIKGQAQMQIDYIYSKFFKSVQNPTLRSYFLLNIHKHKKASNFEFFQEMVVRIAKTNKEPNKLSFLFDIFAGFQSVMKEKQINDFIQVFQLKPDHFDSGAKRKNIEKQEFVEATTFCDLNFKIYEVARFDLIGMLPLIPKDIEDERDAIVAVLNGNTNLEQEINSKLDSDKHWDGGPFYVIEKEFWDSWADNVSFRGNKSKFAIRKEKKQAIDNLSLIEDGHEFRMKEVYYNENFIIVPKSVYRPLSRWYNCNKEI